MWYRFAMCLKPLAIVWSSTFAQQASRILLTLDRDFGELAFHRGLPAEGGVILLRLSGTSPEADNARSLTATLSRTDWPGYVSTITDKRIRMRRLR